MAIMPPTREYSPPFGPRPSGIEFDLLDLLLVISERKYTIILATLIGCYCGYRAGFARPPCLYRTGSHHATPAGAVQRRPDQPARQSGILDRARRGWALKDPNDLYLAILQSDTIADALIKRLDLQSVYHTKKLSEARL